MQTVLTNKQVATRKPHKCYGCQKEFPPQSQMRVLITANDGSVNSTYYCQHCDNHSKDWTIDDWESTLPGGIGYWKDDQWHPTE